MQEVAFLRLQFVQAGVVDAQPFLGGALALDETLMEPFPEVLVGLGLHQLAPQA
ncbi:hypothetical protein [Leisingera aquaemixtae]|uniref:hypothetical protein n=1 Tax=Leisingera aquaemixtae TaxID=1396826 RepID=UPI0021BD81DE|nr:hypothetical protein [Leisingera aquaemixtae]